MARNRFSSDTRSYFQNVSVLRSALPSWKTALFRPLVLFVAIAGIIFCLSDIGMGAENQTRGESAATDRIAHRDRTQTGLTAAREKSAETSNTSAASRKEKGAYNNNVERWQELPSAEKKELRKRMDQWRNLSPQEQEKYRRRYDKLQNMPPAQRKKVDQGLENWDTLPPAEKEEIRQLFEE